MRKLFLHRSQANGDESIADGLTSSSCPRCVVMSRLKGKRPCCDGLAIPVYTGDAVMLEPQMEKHTMEKHTHTHNGKAIKRNGKQGGNIGVIDEYKNKNLKNSRGALRSRLLFYILRSRIFFKGKNNANAIGKIRNCPAPGPEKT